MAQVTNAKTYRVLSGIGAGAGAALVMMLVMAGLRFAANLPTIPEIMINPIVKFLGGQAFSDALDRLYYAGRPLLFTFMLEGTLLLGVVLGLVYARLARPNPATGRRLPVFNSPIGGVVYGLAIGFLLNTVFLPLMDQPVFASRAYGPGLDSPVPLWAGLMLLALVFGATLHYLLLRGQTSVAPAAVPESNPAFADAERAVDRRQVLRIAGGALLALFGGVGLVVAGTIRNQGGLTSPVNRVGADNPDNADVAQNTGSDLSPSGGVGGLEPTQEPTAAPPTDTPEPPRPTDTPEPAPTTGGEVSEPTAEPIVEPTPTTASTNTPVPAIKVQEITPTESFYHVSKNFFDPSPGADGWQLHIRGMVDKVYSLTYKELIALPAVKVTTGMMCISNPIGGGLIGNTTWKGVRLADLLKKAAPKKGVVDVVLRAVDDYSDSITYKKALDPDVVLVWEMGGKPLTSQHGFPARLLVPGIYGMKHLKWLTSIELVNEDYKGYWQQPAQGWSDPAPVNTMSRIDLPSEGTLAMKPQVISGVAFAGDRSIGKVEVSADGGATWAEAYVKPPLSGTSWVVWGYEWTPARPGKYTVQVRATDGQGDLQTPTKAEPYPNGATGYHTVTYNVK